jgi:hypothetical protein
MYARIVLAGEQPLWINGELTDERRDDFREKASVDRVVAILEERSERLGRHAQHRRDVLAAVAGLPRDNAADALSNGFDKWIVDRLRQGRSPRWLYREEKKVPFYCKLDAEVAGDGRMDATALPSIDVSRTNFMAFLLIRDALREPRDVLPPLTRHLGPIFGRPRLLASRLGPTSAPRAAPTVRRTRALTLRSAPPHTPRHANR